jgi:predicted nuclease of predicted toxin-antitoxin system
LRALLDEQVPAELADLVSAAGPEHVVRTVADEGWKGLKNGELLQRMREAEFSALVTVDRRMEYQQNIPRSGIALVVLHAFRARIQELAPLAPAIASPLDRIQPGEIIHLYAPPTVT